MADASWFTVTSTTIFEGERLADAHRSGIFGAGGTDTSPHLSWEGAIRDTPTGSGFWHGIVADLPADCTSLPTGAGEEGSGALPPGAYQLCNDASLRTSSVPCLLLAMAGIAASSLVHALDVAEIGVGKTLDQGMGTVAPIAAPMMAIRTAASGPASSISNP